MATVQYSQKKNVGARATPANQPAAVYCDLCRRSSFKSVSSSDTVSMFLRARCTNPPPTFNVYPQELQDHMHSMAHHRELEAVMGR